MRTKYLSVAALLITGFLVGCHRDDQIHSYTVSNGQPAPVPAQTAPAMSMGDPNAQAVPVNAAPVKWTTPSTWKEVAPTAIRIGNFVVPGPGGKHAEVTITSFPGEMGGALVNVNRWRSENGLNEITEAELTSQPATVDGSSGKIYDMAGATTRTVVAIVPREGASWFFKLRGDSDVVTSAQPAFVEFLKSIRFGGPGTTVMASGTMPTPPADNSTVAVEATPTPAPGSIPTFTVPPTWTETPAGTMVVKSYAISGDGNQKAAVSISVFAGATGGIFSNVNRWRSQLSLGPITEADLPANTKSVDVMGGQATVVDFTGTDKLGQPGRLVAAIVPHGPDTWFYKLTGDNSVVEREKAAFIKFVQTVQY